MRRNWFELLSSSCACAVIPVPCLNIHFTPPTNLRANCSWHGPDWLIDILCVALKGTVAVMTRMSVDLSLFLSLSLSLHLVAFAGNKFTANSASNTPNTFCQLFTMWATPREQEICLPIRSHKHARPALKLYTCLCVLCVCLPLMLWRYTGAWCLRNLSQLIFCPKC